jgi:hypothetical protein
MKTSKSTALFLLLSSALFACGSSPEASFVSNCQTAHYACTYVHGGGRSTQEVHKEYGGCYLGMYELRADGKVSDYGGYTVDWMLHDDDSIEFISRGKSDFICEPTQKPSPKEPSPSSGSGGGTSGIKTSCSECLRICYEVGYSNCTSVCC